MGQMTQPTVSKHWRKRIIYAYVHMCTGFQWQSCIFSAPI